MARLGRPPHFRARESPGREQPTAPTGSRALVRDLRERADGAVTEPVPTAGGAAGSGSAPAPGPKAA
ncbi:hypothetical protein Sgou_58610 [Streptomyces gougerotii]|nr:hypothetical protein Sgou_58610 [Streptomyces gougerotii]